MKQNGWWLIGVCLYAGVGVVLYLVIKGGTDRPDPDPGERERLTMHPRHVTPMATPYDWAKDPAYQVEPYDWAQN